MRLSATPLGKEYGLDPEARVPRRRGARLSEFSFAPAGLRLVIATSPADSFEVVHVEYLFPYVRGFRCLDEGDLIRYWESGVFQSRHHLYEITEGGWMAQELQTAGMMSVSDGMGYREWFVMTEDDCINVVSDSPPMIREIR